MIPNGRSMSTAVAAASRATIGGPLGRAPVGTHVRSTVARTRQGRGKGEQAASGGRQQRIGLRRLLGLAAFLPLASRAPIYGRLIFELIRDERTPVGRKAMLAGALGYL